MKGVEGMEAQFLTGGDRSLYVKLGDEISLEVNGRVKSLMQKLEADPVDGIMEMVPTYATLMIHYRPEKILYKQLVEEVKKRLNADDEKQEEISQIVKVLPICYDKEFAWDLDECAAFEQVSVEEFIRMHSEHEYYAYMLGVAPGHAYMARFEEPFHFKRRTEPRVRINGRSIVAAENQSNLIPFDQPCGWNIVAGTPCNICDYSKKEPFLVNAGDWVKYQPVSRKEYDKIRKDVEKGTYKLETYVKKVVK